jgi:hypothetical protein
MSKLTPEQKRAEEKFLGAADELMKAAAADLGIAESAFMAPVEESRFEARIDVPPPPADEDDEEEEDQTDSSGQWLSAPSVRNQSTKFPDTVRLAEPKTVILDLANTEHLKELNRLQAESAVTNPSLSITELDRQFYQGKWSVYLTYCKVQYLKL